MKHTFGTRALALALSLMLCLGLFPARALAAGDGTFYFAAANEEGFVVPPEKLSYTAGMTVREALLASDHTFGGLENSDWISSVDGVVANYVRSDDKGGYDLDASADSVEMFCLDVRENFLTDGRQALIRAMADLMEEEPDVRAAAEDEYQAALDAYATADDSRAGELAADITDAVAEYQKNLENTFPITFTAEDGTPYAGEVTAENKYGRIFTDDDSDGVLELPWGETYTFTIRRDFARVDGSVRVTGAQTITADLPEGDWMAEGARLSLSGGSGFEDSELKLTPEGHTFTAQVPDTYATGSVYLCAQYDPEQFTGVSPKLYACYTNTDGEIIAPETDDNASKQTWNSKYTSTAGALSAGSEGTEIIYRVTVENGAYGYTYAQEYTLVLERSLSLSGIRVTDQEGTGQAPTVSFDPETREYTYRVLSTVTSVNILPTAFRKNYTVRVNGTLLSDLSAIPLTEDSTTVTIALSQGKAQGEYTLTFTRAAGQNITLTTVDSGTTLEVFNKNGEVLKTYKDLDTGGGWAYRYTLVPGETYYYVATKGEFYHTTRTFTLEEASGTSARISVPTEDALTALVLGDHVSLDPAYSLEEPVAPETHRYTLAVSDRNANLFLKAAGTEGMTVQALYTTVSGTASSHGKSRTVSLTNGGTRGVTLPNALMSNAVGNEITLRFSQVVDGITQYQDYIIQVQRTLSLGSLAAECGGSTLLLEPAYSPAVTEYAVTVPMAAASLDITALLRDNTTPPFGAESDGYWVEINGVRAAGKTAVPLSGDDTEEKITITVGSDAQTTGSSTQITLTVRKAAPVLATAALTPETGLLVLTDRGTGNRVWPGDDGTFALSEGFSYDWRLTAQGYVGRGGTLSVEKTESGETVLALSTGETISTMAGENGTLTAALTLSLGKAAENTTLDPNLEAEWADFRGTSYTYDAATGTLTAGGSNYTNNGITAAPVPVESLNTELSWAVQLGEDYSSGAVGCPILVDGDLITYAKTTIYRIDTVSGEVLAQGTMAATTSFGINNATYYGGMIFVGLSDGRVQAFDAKTLESLWLFQDDLGGQPNCPITVYDGYLYTGFWRSEDRDAHFVCLSITDEDPTQTLEKKLPTWTVTRRGGFYWAGAYVCKDFVLIGTDDGQSGCVDSAGDPNRTAALLMLDPRTGALLDSREGMPGDIRSAVSYDAKTDAYYFATKGGYFCQAKVGKDETGAWKITAVRELALTNGGSKKNPAMSTCTPVVYNGRAYLGVSGVGQFSAWSGHNITVIDLASWSIAYTVPTPGYPQTSGLLTTAYAEKNQYVYVYFFDNYTPGVLRVLRDRPDQTAPEHTTTEKYTDKGQTTVYNSAYALFTPSGDQAQYAICSPITDRYGTIYFKNDSAHLMAFGSAIEKLEVTQAPAKTKYVVGETFDPTGMVVMAHYANGTSRDVTKYLTYSQDALALDDSGNLTLTFPYVMYHNADNQDGTSRAGVTGSKPTVQVDITVTTPKTDVKVDWTAGAIRITTGSEKQAETVLAAVYDAAGRMLSVVEARVVDGVVTLTPAQLGKGVTVKVFWQDAAQAPVGEAWTVTREN